MISQMIATLFLGYSNGANDNFKGVATLWGSGTTSYKKAITWATVCTFAGSLAAVYLSQKLIIQFSGKSLLPDEIVQQPGFMIAVGFGAALTIFVAALTGIPISTTHGLTGALVGAGLVASGFSMNFSALGRNFVIPLLMSPVVAILFTVAIYPLLRIIRKKSGVTKKTCVCVYEKDYNVLPFSGDKSVALDAEGGFLVVRKAENCREVYQGRIFGIEARQLLDFLHFISGGVLSFARGLNDTPKIVALVVWVNIFPTATAILLVGLVIAAGGALSSKKVAVTMSHSITRMNHGQGFTANIVTASIVILSSVMGWPVSTTHVSCGSLFGVGMVTRQVNWKTVYGIVGAWLTTLPLAALFSAVIYFFVK